MEDQNAESQLDALVVCLMYVAIAVLQPVSSPHVSTHSETLHCAGWAESVEAMVHGINMPDGVWNPGDAIAIDYIVGATSVTCPLENRPVWPNHRTNSICH